VQKWPDVTDWVARNGATSIPGQVTDAATGLPNCKNVCDDLFLQEHRGIPGQQSSKDMYKELGRLENKVGMWPKIGNALGAAGMAVSAGTVGFAIGTQINRKFLRLGLPNPMPMGEPGDPYGWVWQPSDPFKYLFLEANAKLYTVNNTSQGNDVEGTVLDHDALIVRDWRPGIAAQAQITQYNAGADQETARGCYQRGLIMSGEGFIQWQLPLNAQGGGHCQFTEDYACGAGGTMTCQRTVSVTEYPYVQYLEPEGLQVSAPKDFDPATDGVPSFDVQNWPGKPADRSQLESRVKAELDGHPERYPALREFIGTTIEEPPGFLDIPDCNGMTLQKCLALLEEQGFTGVHHTVTLDSDDAYVGLPPLTVVETDPRRGGRVATDGDIIIRRNPRPEDMPTRVPQIVPGTSREQVERDLTDADLVPKFREASEPDPTAGPEQVTRAGTSPAPGSKVARGTDVNVELNPSTAPPAPGGSPGGGGINFTPLTGLTPCTKFPFGVPCWVKDALDGLIAPADAPHFSVAIPYVDKSLDVDLESVEPMIGLVRPVLLIASLLGLGFMFMRMTGGFGGGGRGDD
jgi:hypothetical protein